MLLFSRAFVFSFCSLSISLSLYVSVANLIVCELISILVFPLHVCSALSRYIVPWLPFPLSVSMYPSLSLSPSLPPPSVHPSLFLYLVLPFLVISCPLALLIYFYIPVVFWVSLCAVLSVYRSLLRFFVLFSLSLVLSFYTCLCLVDSLCLPFSTEFNTAYVSLSLSLFLSGPLPLSLGRSPVADASTVGTGSKASKDGTMRSRRPWSRAREIPWYDR